MSHFGQQICRELEINVQEFITSVWSACSAHEALYFGLFSMTSPVQILRSLIQMQKLEMLLSLKTTLAAMNVSV